MIRANRRTFCSSTPLIAPAARSRDLAVLRRQQIEDLGAGQLLAVEREAQRRHGLVEQPDPGAAAGDVFLVQRLLDLVGQLVRPKAPHGIEPGAEAPEPGDAASHGRQQTHPPSLLSSSVTNSRLRTDRGDALLHALIEATDVGIVALAANSSWANEKTRPMRSSSAS